MSGLTSLFKRPKVPTPRRPDPVAPTPERSDGETAALADEQRQKFLAGKGRAATLFSNQTKSESGAVALLGGAAQT